MEELKSLKTKTRILTILMFLATYICFLGAEGLSQNFGISPGAAAGIVSIATFAITQYGTEKRVVRAEALKDQEYENAEMTDDDQRE